MPRKIVIDPKQLTPVARSLHDEAARMRTRAGTVMGVQFPADMDQQVRARIEDKRFYVSRQLRRSDSDLMAQHSDITKRIKQLREDRWEAKLRRWKRKKYTKAELVILRRKRRLLALARRLRIKIPKGFNPNIPVTGRYARRLIRMVSKRLGIPVTSDWNPLLLKAMNRLATVSFPPGKYPGDNASAQAMACYLASQGAAMGAPPELLVMISLAESSLMNTGTGHADSVGFFQIRVGLHEVPPGFGKASGTHASKAWWQDHPAAQMAWMRHEVKGTLGTHGWNANTDGAAALGAWAVAIERPARQYEGRYAANYDQARRMVAKCRATKDNGGGPGSAVGGGGGNGTGGTTPPPGPRSAAVLSAARGELSKGVHEIGGENRGPDVAKYLKTTGLGTGPNSPWCAAFVTWCLLKAGKRMPAPSWKWAGVQNWVNAARGKDHGLRVVSAKDARPGDLVAYDWDGGNNFAPPQSHIGILTSKVSNGAFTTIEGNHNDRVDDVNRTMGSARDIVFIRVEQPS